MFQNRNAELMKTVTYLQRKLKKETAWWITHWY
jgi:hypothetical protein